MAEETAFSACEVAEQWRIPSAIMSFAAVLGVLSFAAPCNSSSGRKTLASLGIAIFTLVGIAAIRSPFEIHGVLGFLLALGAGCIVFPIYYWFAMRFLNKPLSLDRSQVSLLRDIYDMAKLTLVSLGLPLVAFFKLLVLAQGFSGMAQMNRNLNCSKVGEEPWMVWIALLGISMAVTFWSVNVVSENSTSLLSHRFPFSYKVVLAPCIYLWAYMLHTPSEVAFFPGFQPQEVLHSNSSHVRNSCSQHLSNFTGNCFNSTEERYCLETWRCKQSDSLACNCCLTGCLDCNHLTAVIQCQRLSWVMMHASAADSRDESEIGTWQLGAAEESGAVKNVTENFCEQGYCTATSFANTSATINLTDADVLCLACMSAVQVVRQIAKGELFHRKVGESFVLTLFTFTRVAGWYALGLYIWLLLRRVLRGSMLPAGDSISRDLSAATLWRRETRRRDAWMSEDERRFAARNLRHRRSLSGSDDEATPELKFRNGLKKRIVDCILFPFRLPLLLIAGVIYWIGALWASDRFCQAMTATWQTGGTLLLLFKTSEESLDDDISLCEVSWELSFHLLTVALVISVLMFCMYTCACSSRSMLWAWFKGLLSLVAGCVLVIIYMSQADPASRRLFEWFREFLEIPHMSLSFPAGLRSSASVVCLAVFLAVVLKDFSIVGHSELVVGARLGQATAVIWKIVGFAWAIASYLLIFVAVQLGSVRAIIIRSAAVQQQFLAELSRACARESEKEEVQDDESITNYSFFSDDIIACPRTGGGTVKLQPLTEMLLSVTLHRPTGWFLWPILAGPRGRLLSARQVLNESLSILERAEAEINHQSIVVAANNSYSDNWSLESVVDAIENGMLGPSSECNLKVSARGLALSAERRLYEAASVLEYIASVIGHGADNVKQLVTRVFEHREVLILVEAHDIFSRLASQLDEPSQSNLVDAAMAAEQWERLQSCDSLQQKLADGVLPRAHIFVNRWRLQLQDCLHRAAKQAVKENDVQQRRKALADVLSAAGQSKSQLGLDIEGVQRLKQEVLEEELRRVFHSAASDLWEVSNARSLRLHRLIGMSEEYTRSDDAFKLLRPQLRHVTLWCKQLKEEERAESGPSSHMWFDEIATKVLGEVVATVMREYNRIDGLVSIRTGSYERGVAAVCLAVVLGLNISSTSEATPAAGDAAASAQVQPSLIGRLFSHDPSRSGTISSQVLPVEEEEASGLVPAVAFAEQLQKQMVVACELQLWDIAQSAVEARDDLSILLQMARTAAVPGAAHQRLCAAFNVHRPWFDAQALRELQAARPSDSALQHWERILGLYTAVRYLRGGAPLDDELLLEEVQLVVNGAADMPEVSVPEDSAEDTERRIVARMWNRVWGAGGAVQKSGCEVLQPLRALAICFLAAGGHGSSTEELAAAKLRLSLQHSWEDGLLQGLLEAEAADSKIPAALSQKAREMFCTLHSLPRDMNLSALFMAGGSRQSVRMTGLGRLNSLGNGVLDAQVSDGMLPMFQQLMNETYRAVLTKDRRDGAVPEKYEVVKVIKIFNAKTYQGYLNRLQDIERELHNNLGALTDYDLMTAERCKQIATEFEVPPLHEAGLEAFLFHGTKPDGARSVAVENFDLKFARDGLFGRGIYLAESCSKSDEYTSPDRDGLRPLLLCRVALGKINYCEERSPNKRDLETACTGGGFHSVLGDRRKVHNTFREFIVYDPLQVCTHFVLWYRRR